jgi:AcrR family transcriptional regulator
VPRPRSIEDATILRAAREVFVKKGATATTREVAEHAGVSEGVLFQRYKTKADLFFAALAPPVADPAAALPTGAEASGDREALEEAALSILAYFREAMPLLLPLVTHPSFDPERFFHHEAPASLQGWIDALVRFLDAQRGDDARPMDSRGAATLLTSSLFGVALIDTIGIHKDPLPEASIKAMVRALWDGIGPQPVRASGHR